MVDCSCSVPVFNMDGLRVAKNASDESQWVIESTLDGLTLISGFKSDYPNQEV
jgi:hypothetical protein